MLINEDKESSDSKKLTPSKRKKFEQSENDNHQSQNKNGKKTKFEKIKPPTLEEINELKETRNLFHSNLFRLQVKEMLEELKIKEKYKNFLTNWLDRFREFLNGLQSQETTSANNSIDWLNETPIQMPLKLEQIRHKKRSFNFQFLKPAAEAYFIGAASTHSLLGPKIVADVCIPMPASCFQKENYLNLVYDEKRALYLAYITKQILENGFDRVELAHLRFSNFGNNPLKPILIVTPPGKVNEKKKLAIRIFVSAEEETFKLNRFVPFNNNVRSKIFENGDENDSAENAPTPHYNANVLFDLTMHRNQKTLSSTFESHKNFQEALILLKVWLQQRHLHIGFTGFSAHMVAMFICYLQRQRKLHQNMSSYQVARTVWNHLAHSTWETPSQGISLCDGNDSTTTANRPTLEQFHEQYEVVFIDATGYYNICANLSLEMYKRVKLECKQAVDMLNDMKMNSFQTLFMTKYPLYTQLDHILKISKSDAVDQILEMHVPLAVKQDYAGYIFPQLLKVVGSILQKGLGHRMQALLPIEIVGPDWSCISPPDYNFERNLQLGIILHPTHAYEVLDKGPESIDSAAELFRRFWGDKAKLRRFQDGTITESVVWTSNTDTLAQKRLVSRSIVLHLLQHHFQLEPSDVVYIAGELDIVYKLTPAFKTDRMHEKYKVAQDTDSEFLCLRVIHIFDDLARKLHALKELPLEIVSIIGTSAVFRYCEPTPLLPQARIIGENMHASNVQHGIIQLAFSGKWPSELPALQAMKTAFYLQISQLIRDKYKYPTKVMYSGILILKQGYCFKIEIAHPKELALLKQSQTERGITQYIDSPASIELEKRHYVLPKVTGALHALHSQHPSFGGTVMIAKRWLYAQLIDSGLWPDECTELLNAFLYLRTVGTEKITCSPQAGFLRFLQLIAYSDWKAELFLINFNNTMDENQISELEHNFNSERSNFPPLCIATAYDRGHYGKLWTSAQQPNVNVLARVTLLAREALEMIESSILSPDEGFVRPSRLFVPSTQGYDLVIQLKPDEVVNTTAFDFGSAFSALTKPNWRLPLADSKFLDNAVAKLREAYGDFAAFFYNPCGGKDIGIVWKPSAFDEKDFKVNEIQACNPTKNQKVQCSRETLIEDFKFILKEFYLRIDTVESVISSSKISAAHSLHMNISKQRYFDTTQTEKRKEYVFPQKIQNKKSSSLIESKNKNKIKLKKGKMVEVKSTKKGLKAQKIKQKKQ